MCADVYDDSILAESKKGFQRIIDDNGEHAKKCLDLSCGKVFYVGEECPFCTIILPYCERCHRIEINNKMELPLQAFVFIRDRPLGEKMKIINFTCNSCKDDELCATQPLARCTER